MNPDSGFIVRSHIRTITRNDLPPEIIYPFEQTAPIEGEEIIYWRKNYGLCQAVLDYCSRENLFKDPNCEEYHLTREHIFDIVDIILYFMDEKTWIDEANSMWTYNEVLSYLRKIINNLLVIRRFMKYNEDIYLVFYY